MTEKEYRDYPAINYSLLKKLEYAPKTALVSAPIESDGILAGSVLDCLMTDTKENFEKRFVVASEAITPQPQVLNFSKRLSVLGTDSEENKRKAYEECNIQKLKFESFVEKWEKEGREYYNFLKRTEGKQVVDPFTYKACLDGAEVLRNHSFTSKWFKAGFDEEVLFQTPIIFNAAPSYEGKALLDIIKIDHMEKVIYPKDLKSMSDYLSSFLPVSFVKYRYDLQAAYYTEAVNQWRDKNYPGYTVANFGFIVLSFNELNSPLLFNCSDRDLLCGRSGGTTKTGRVVRGWEALVSDYIWHKENDLWDYPRAVYQNKGVLTTEMYL